MRLLSVTPHRHVPRLLIVLLVFGISSWFPSSPIVAQGSGDDKAALYSNEVIGVSFQYPASWAVEEKLTAQTVTVGTRTDLEVVRSGGTPAGVIFMLSLTNFRTLGIDGAAQLADALAPYTSGAATSPVKVGELSGSGAEWQDPATNTAVLTLMFSVGERRVAIVRSFGTLGVWNDGGRAQAEQIISTLTFFEVGVNAGLPTIGAFAWATPLDGATILTDLDLTADSTTLVISDGERGIRHLLTNGQAVAGSERRPAEIGAFGSLALLRDGRRYLADPVNGVIWRENAEGTAVVKYLGAKGNVFSPGSPRQFAFGADGLLLALDESQQATRVLVFNRGGALINTWFLATTINATLDAPVIATDGSGKLYVAARNSGGVFRYFADGTLDRAGIGGDLLTATAPLALLVDRFDNILVATEDRGILKYDPSGTLIGIIGQPSDQAAPPKPGQLGRPTALVVSADGNLLYVADSGTYPQIVSFAIDNNLEVNVVAGTQAAGKIIYGDTVSATITATAFVYEYTFAARRNDLVTITATAADPAVLDTFVELIGLKGTRLVASDDVGAGVGGLAASDAQIVAFRIPANGEYTIRVTRFGRETTSATGAFTLRLEKVN
jgi:sugar lactone lactonase YvrE